MGLSRRLRHGDWPSGSGASSVSRMTTVQSGLDRNDPSNLPSLE
jgi:hypothetical protein